MINASTNVREIKPAVPIPSTKIEPMSPTKFAPFDGRVDVLAVAFNKAATILWSNQAYAKTFNLTTDTVKGTSAFSLWTRPFMQERLQLLEKALQEGRNVAYFQLAFGRRCVTRVWPLDPTYFTEPGFFIIIEPAPRRDIFPDAPLAPTAGEIGLSELRTFSKRELEVLRYIGEGLSNKEVAATMDISIKTVENHVAHILQALRVHSRVELVRFATERGLIAFTAEEWKALLSKHSDPGDVPLHGNT